MAMSLELRRCDTCGHQVPSDLYRAHRAHCEQSTPPMLWRISGSGGGPQPISRRDAFNLINNSPPSPPTSRMVSRESSSQLARSQMTAAFEQHRAEAERARSQMAMVFEQHRETAEQMRSLMAAAFEQHRAMIDRATLDMEEAIGHNRYRTAAGAMDSDFATMMEHHRVMTDRAMNSAMQSLRQAGGRRMPHVVMASPFGHSGPYGVVYAQGPPPAARGRGHVPVNKGNIALPQEVLTASAVARLKDTPDCSICLEKFRVKGVITRLPCTHVYHANCIREWLPKSGTCPVCKHRVS